MVNQPNHITVSPAKLEKRNEQVGNAGNVWELLTTGATTFALAPAMFKYVADFAVRAELFKHITNGIGLLAVLFYAVNFSNVMASDNHIYAVYQLFPVFASLAITTTLWTTPANSLLRVLYIVGLYTISWMGV